MWKSLAMESPLDILSRAAGMVSRNHEVTTPTNSGSSSSNNSIINNSHHLNNENPSCRILKLALVSSNGHSNGISSSQDVPSPKNKNGYEPSSEMTPPPDARASPEVILGLAIDSDTPLDMSIKKPRRMVGAVVTEADERGNGSVSRSEEEVVKRKRPSVIVPPMSNNLAGFDVDDHFKESLGLETYNSVFSAKSTGSTSPEVSPVPTTNDDRNHEEEKLKSSSASKLKIQQSADPENSVDDHFAKALGKQTWMKLQGL